MREVRTCDRKRMSSRFALRPRRRATVARRRRRVKARPGADLAALAVTATTPAGGGRILATDGEGPSGERRIDSPLHLFR